MSPHAELLARHRRVLPAWLDLYYDEPIELATGQGRHVTDGEGATYLDLFGGILTTLSGYAVPEVVNAIAEQARKMIHSSTLYMIRPQVELAEEIVRLVPVPNAKVFFTTSGTDAIETALLLATTRRRSNQVLAMRNSYHGRSFAAISVTGNRAWSPSSLSPLSVSYVYGGYRYRSPFEKLSDDDFVSACLADLRDTIDTTTAGDVACLIAEPIQGVGGFTSPSDGLYGAVKRVLDEHGILFISDEVQTGWGRTGTHFWGIDAHGVQPDMLVFAKGLGNGLTIGGIAARAELIDELPAKSICTFGGNHLSTAAALANLRYVLDNDLQGNARRMGKRLLEGLQQSAGQEDIVGEVRGKGLIVGVECVEPGTHRPNPGVATRILAEARERGVLIGKGGLYGNVLRIAPPLSITEDEVEQALRALNEAVSAVAEG